MTEQQSEDIELSDSKDVRPRKPWYRRWFTWVIVLIFDIFVTGFFEILLGL